MATDGPSWADQWGAGGIGAMEEDDNTNDTKKDSNNNKKAGGLNKAKAAAMASAQKIKTGYLYHGST
ncbi:hypothetical protein FEM48_Zijuj01G0125300 [Ziziphus jujuba var. spinosa]|uniref:Uncharacterized protein n=1 Tax=Ziziphus jujuba var. spinosa TaxID=714518 RepID=A0A978W1A2_ZIZJJ|nr:hypothetical protein FEM48_Zijuj01G0125300 [Ziziphus jujuba var. spinosa]